MPCSCAKKSRSDMTLDDMVDVGNFSSFIFLVF